MEKYPKISIITASFNQGDYIEDTILSVIGQDYPNLEYIVIDGGSTDDSIDIIKKYSDKIAFWESVKDKGQSDAINKGLKMATGEIIGWLNSDDLLTANSLFTLASVFKNPDINIIFSPINVLRKDGRIEGVSDRRIMDFESLFYGSQVVNQEGIFWRRMIHDRIGFLDIKLNYAMDYDFFLRCCLQYIPFRIESVLAGHRKHLKQKTNTTDAYLKEMTEIRFNYKKIFGISYFIFWCNSFYQSKRRIINIFGIRNIFKKEWMDRH